MRSIAGPRHGGSGEEIGVPSEDGQTKKNHPRQELPTSTFSNPKTMF